MEKQLTWEEIKKQYDQEWVELVDCEWPDTEINPLSGVVRVHAKTHEEFHRQLSELPSVDSALIFVGEPKVEKNVLVGSRQTMTIIPCHA